MQNLKFVTKQYNKLTQSLITLNEHHLRGKDLRL